MESRGVGTIQLVSSDSEETPGIIAASTFDAVQLQRKTGSAVSLHGVVGWANEKERQHVLHNSDRLIVYKNRALPSHNKPVYHHSPTSSFSNSNHFKSYHINLSHTKPLLLFPQAPSPPSPLKYVELARSHHCHHRRPQPPANLGLRHHPRTQDRHVDLRQRRG